MFVLFDLIGAKNSQFSNLFNISTGKYYWRLQQIGQSTGEKVSLGHSIVLDVEKELLGVYQSDERTSAMFSSKTYDSIIEDDHTPFLGYGKSTPIVKVTVLPYLI